MTKNNGHIFEDEFRKSVPEGVYFKKLKVSGQNYKGGGNEGDFLIYLYPNLYILELKSHKGKSIPFDCLRENQIKGLDFLTTVGGVKCGFIFNFRDLEETYFIDIKKIVKFIKEGKRKSFPIEWVREEGILIEQKKLRVRYRYNLHKFLSEV